jgi:hypothetical protein
MSDYESFMVWFHENHPALFEKYHENITISPFTGLNVAVNNNNQISDKVFNHLNHVANCYYSRKDVGLLDSVRYVYPPEIRKDEGWEASMLINVTMWLNPLINKINKQNGIVRITFINHGVNTAGSQSV